MTGKISALLLLLCYSVFFYRRLLSYLRYFQQEEYNELRFSSWIEEKEARDTRGTFVGLAAACSSILVTYAAWTVLTAVVSAVTLLWISLVIEEDPRKTGKLTLKMTTRARKIHLTAFVIGMIAISTLAVLAAALSPCCASFCSVTPVAWRSIVVAGIGIALISRWTPQLLVYANRLLAPAEKSLQQHYVNEAKRLLSEVSPLVIGITGSYGKTGAKSALGELLPQCLGPTFWPKKSINTVMGITRDIRENLRPHHRYAVIEMGAYGVGSIKKLCALTPPQAAIVTAVGIMHLERFGSEENVYNAKSELPNAVPDNGILVCNGDNPGARRMAQELRKGTTLLYGLDPSAGALDCWASEISFSAAGTSCVLHWRGKSHQVTLSLLGRPALSNAIGAFTMACALGAAPEYAAACLANLTPVDNRLVLDRKGPITFIRDAYNSNPTGFTAALEMLKTVDGKRRILLTPGMIELGERQHSENSAIAEKAADICDLIIVVSSVNRAAWREGLTRKNYSAEKTVILDSRSEAFDYLAKIQEPGDVVLIENDLGDLLEGTVKF